MIYLVPLLCLFLVIAFCVCLHLILFMEQEAPWLMKKPQKLITFKQITNSARVEAMTPPKKSANSLYLPDHTRARLPYALRENTVRFQS